MIITELIKKLEKIKQENGDLSVEVQYRDSGGGYYGTDTYLDLEIKNGKLIL